LVLTALTNLWNLKWNEAKWMEPELYNPLSTASCEWAQYSERQYHCGSDLCLKGVCRWWHCLWGEIPLACLL